tara:strand:+ start:518 stop:799 length:282 start_codon:yes stop_codon:yes gene_type:complete
VKITKNQLRRIIKEEKRKLLSEEFTVKDAISDSGDFDKVFAAADILKLAQATDGYLAPEEVEEVKALFYKIVSQNFPDAELIDVYKALGGIEG